MRAQASLRFGLLMVCLFGGGAAGQETPSPGGTNLMPNASAEETVAADEYPRNLRGVGPGITNSPRLPTGFALYHGAGSVSWGASTSHAHSGTSSAFMTFTDWQTVRGEKTVNADLVFASSDGYNGATAMPARAGDWYYSFWVKGDLPLLTPRVFVWNEDAGKPNQRGKLISPALDIIPRSTWQRVRGRFALDPAVRRFALSIHLGNVPGLAPGQTVYVDDVSIRQLAVTPLEPRSAVAVAVYDNGAPGARSAAPLLQSLMEAGIAATTVTDLRRETLLPFDVLILSSVENLSPVDAGDPDRDIPGSEWPSTILNFIDSGKGVVFGHTSTGLRGAFSSMILTPSIAVGTGERDEKGTFTVTGRDHPIMEGVPVSFANAHSHYVTLTAGRAGKVLAIDAEGRAVVAAGEVSRGRVVALGYPMGAPTRNGESPTSLGASPLSSAEKGILINSVRWAAGRPRYDVPGEITDSTLLADAKRYNDSAGAAAMAKYKDLPSPRFDESILWTYLFMGGPAPMRLDAPEKIKKVLDNAKRMRFTTVMTIAKGGYFLYPSRRFPNEEHRFCTDAFDPLGTFVSEARARGLRVGLIIEPFKNSREWGRYAPDLLQIEADQIRNGVLEIGDVDKDRPWARFNCPDHPEVRERAIAISEEIIKTYDPDILYLDYIRYKTGYDTSCFCDYSVDRKAEFARRHPEMGPADAVKAYAEESLVGFVTEWVRRCKLAKPSLTTSCYTISAPMYKAPAWVNRYPVDWHAKYVSRNLSGPESSVEDVGALTKRYSAWLRDGSGRSVFSPIIASYERKTPERLIAEFKMLSMALDEVKPARRIVEYYDYIFLMRNQDYDVDEALADAIAAMLEGGAGEK